MQAIVQNTSVSSAGNMSSNRSLWAGRVLSGLVSAFLALDAVMKLIQPEPVRAASAQLGLPDDVGVGLGIVLLSCVALYLIPRTRVVGAVLLTGYLGGAVAIHVRVHDPLFSRALFPVYFGILTWGGLYLRDARVRAAIGPAT